MTIINTNIGAINAQATMTRVNDQFNTAMTRLSTGLRINAAKDDAAGMAIGEKMTAQVMGLNQAVRNATDGKNLVDTTEGAHVEISNMLQRMRELAVQSSNDTNTASNRGNIMSEANQLISEINRVSETTTFNGMKVLDGSFTGKQLQIGADAGQVLALDIDSAAATAIGGNFATTDVGVVDSASTIAGETLTITGSEGSADVVVAAGASAKDVAASVNGVEASTGVSATAVTKAKLSALSDTGSITMSINGTSIGNVAVSDTTDLRSLRDAINNYSGTTGVTASMGDTDGEIVLTASDGANIELTDFDHSGAAGETLTVTGLNADGTDSTSTTNSSDLTQGGADLATVTGQVTFSSAKGFVVASDGDATDGTSFTEVASEASALTTVSEIDLTSVEGAAEAIQVIDMALQKISQSRSDLGAVSNRLDSTISNLTNISTNVQAAKSQVMDADFATESTNLARGQILSQAATAMLAQANSSKQNVMSLLRG